jgi:DNA repair exonuclease SbcCD ATPase subunit
MIEVQSANRVIDEEVETLKKEQQSLTDQLNAPLQKYQKYSEELSAWQSKVAEEKGNREDPSSLDGLKARFEQLNNLPHQLKELHNKQMELCLEIFVILDTQRQSREKLFSPVQDLISNDELIREEYKLQFKSELTCTSDYFGAQLFDLVKQNTGDLRGEEESFSYIAGLMDSCDLNTKQGVKDFVSELNKKLRETSSSRASLRPLMRKNKEPAEVYDFIYGLEFLTPRYTLMFQGAHIEQLSPGQRGSLLLIFYLLVDKGSVPIILDQPEENLDNETIVSLLVPVLCKAKQNRQILMVTHNPNLAVVCDAEQIIHCDFDRKNNSKISYVTGAIENATINQKVVDVLEGTMPAFNNRKEKYS